MNLTSEQGLVCAYYFNDNTSAEKLTWQALENFAPTGGVLWVDMDYTHPNAQKWIAQQADTPAFVKEALLADDSRPRTVIYQEGVLTTLRGVNLNPGAEPEDMVSIRIWCKKNLIITTHRRKILSVEDVQKSLTQLSPPHNSGELLVRITECLAQRMADTVENIDEQVDAISENVIETQSYDMRGQLADIRRQIIMIRRYLSPQREALNRLFYEKNPILNENQQLLVRETANRITTYVEELDSARDRANVTYEELMGKLTEQVEKRMYLLSIITAVFLPLSFLTGLLGINVTGIPFADMPGAFYSVCFVLILLVLFQFILFRKFKWL
jgi:zinc transporter